MCRRTNYFSKLSPALDGSALTMSQVDIERLENELKILTVKEINEHPTKSREELALEFFQVASYKESVGQLSEASDYYWKAFKLDDKVDNKYRDILFSARREREAEGKNSHEKSTVKVEPLKLNKGQLNKLLDSYAKCKFIAEDEEKPVFFERLPYEVLQHIIEVLIIRDTPSWINFSVVCKRLAYMGFRDKNVWSLLSRIVYERQNYRDSDEERFKSLIRSQWGNNYYKMLNERPYLKYRGVYISKVTYMKEGARSENSNSWTLPYKMVSYFRYYRFYADGTCLKIITILEPKKVIPKLHKGYTVDEDAELMRENETNQENTVESFNKRSWLRIFAGRYTISLQGDVETNCDGPVEKYRFIDKFKIVNSGQHHRHNKLEWVDLGYYDTVNERHSSLNRENEKDFMFSRVKSYGY